MKAMHFPVLGAALLASACAVTVNPTDPAKPVVKVEVPVVTTDTCGASAFKDRIGQKSPAISLPAGTVFRHYRTGDPVTADFSPQRINFEYNRSGTLVKVSCG